MVAGGVVMTGGSSKMDGLIDLAEEVFHMPVRLGCPQYVSGMDEVLRNPIFATGVGLLIYAQQNRFSHRPLPAEARGLKAVWGRMRGWFQGNF
jgi:cell division protein FtsA